MAERQYISTAGIVQQFPDKEVVSERELNDQEIREFTIKTITKQSLVRITLGPEFSDVEIGKGDFVSADGSFTVSESKGKTYNNLWARELTVTTAVERNDSQASNKKTKTTKKTEAVEEVEEDTEEAPF